MRTRRILAALLLASHLSAQETAKLPANPEAPLFPPPVTDTTATGPDGDGLTNLDEYRYGTDPKNRDTDGDNWTDGQEALGPDTIRQTPVDPSAPGAIVPHDDATDPNDPSDTPAAPRPASALVKFKLGVGDRSGSRSEDYVLNVFCINPATGAEQRIYTLRSGGYGQYAEIYKFFKKDETHTFQIQWLGTTNASPTPLEGADWDYHHVVEPQGTDTGGILIDSYDPVAKTIDTAAPLRDPQDILPASDDDDNVTDFPGTLQLKRIVLLGIAAAPPILPVNGDFDEGNITSVAFMTMGAGNDIQTPSLMVQRNGVKSRILKDTLATDDLHPGWFGVAPNAMPKSFWDGAIITIRKIEQIDPATGEPEAGQARVHATWDPAEELNLEPYNWILSIAELPQPPLPNLANSAYGSASPVPADASFWIEGLVPGKITLEWNLRKNNQDFTYQQTFDIWNPWTKAQWKAVVRDELYLDSFTNSGGPAINGEPVTGLDIDDYLVANEFLNNRPYIYQVYEYYANLGMDDRLPFWWAGLAKMAGAPVYAGLSDAQNGRTGIAIGTFGIIDSSTLTDIQKLLIEANIKIYHDLAYQFVAFRTSGIKSMEHLSELDVEFPIAAWTAISHGKMTQDQDLILSANKLLLRREQEQILANTYDTMLAMENGWIAWFFSIAASNPVPGGPEFDDIVPNGNLAVFNDRWQWISESNQNMWNLWTQNNSFTQGSGLNVVTKTRNVWISTPLRTRAADFNLTPPLR